MANVLSERIAELRKARGLTQEQLGQLAGVSAQAVSKWEKGGAPDVELLPALADRLGVTIDALFGREGGEAGDIHQTAARWLHTIPKEQRYDQICRLFWIFTQNMVDEVTMPDIGYLEQAAALWEDETSGIKQWAISRVWLDGGYMLSLHAEDLSFATVWPEPKDGYDAHFAAMDDYRRLFSVLARPGCLEVLEYLYSRPYRHYMADTVAKALALPIEEAQAVMEVLWETRLVEQTELELVDGLSYAYSRHDGDVTLVPFLYMARCMIQKGAYLFNVGGAGKPLLRGGVWKRTEEERQ
ncbi:MAG: helix-turn-helix transcriptional regulator [Oscillospiraceae bacterium]|jgi:transcriptional regulator with XRE-family HTH domain|nr:helix-turn-helix transcriptional regulator [Oscillospiraceae bacterium]